MSVAELLIAIQVLSRAERLRLVREIIVMLEAELTDEFPVIPTTALLELSGRAKGSSSPWERDPVVAARLRESIAEASAGQVVEKELIDP